MQDEFPPDEAELLMTEGEVAGILGVTPRALQAWRSRSALLPYVTVGRLVRYRPSEVRAFVDAHTVRPTKQQFDTRPYRKGD